MAEYVDSAVQTVLSSSRLKLAHPGNAKLTQVYPTPSETTSVLAQAINHRGQFRVSPNNLNFNSRSDFILSSSALISEMAINGVVTIANGDPARPLKPVAVGWGFDVIESIEITYSNSLMQNMFIRGETLKDYSLLCCCSAKERQDLLKAAGQAVLITEAVDGVNIYRFTVPISFLNHTVASLRNSWPVDGSVLAGPIQVAINWRPSNVGFVKGAGALGAFPNAFTSLELVCKTTQLQDASFSVKKAMMLDPQLVYSLPARYITSVDYSRVIAAPAVVGGVLQYQPFTLNLASAPSGMLEGIIVSIRPQGGAAPLDDWVNPVAQGTVPYKGGSVTLDQIRLEFGGQNIFRVDSYEECQHFQRSTFGDTLEWSGIYYTPDIATTVVAAGTNVFRHMVYFIPLVNDGCSVFRHHTNENLPSYGGSQLQLTLRPSAFQRVKMGRDASVNDRLGGHASGMEGGDYTVAQRGTNFQIWVGFIVSGLLEISQGTVDLQL